MPLLKGQFPLKLAWLQATLCRKWPMSRGVWGGKWMTFPYPLGMIPLSHCGGYELLNFKN